MIHLRDIYLFKDIKAEFINLIIDNSRRTEFTAGTTIIKEGEVSNGEAYIIQEGTVEVIRNEKFIKELTAPDIFGEIALVTDEPRTATVQAKTDMILLKINKELLKSILKDFAH